MTDESVAQAVNRLTAAGYTDDFRAEARGLLAVQSGCVHQPESLIVDEVVRFEGITDPDDEAVVFALRCGEHGTKGTFTIVYGAQVPEADAAMARRLRLEHG
ncbi:MAG TPA: hypothetical protein VMT89_11785 [Candidatus Acidoferrales bacterium]|nr:hypothetical protein [Candidatus Acidoferrales bacterium]